MSKCTGKCKQRYLDHPIDRSKLTSLIHGTSHNLEKCKSPNNFSTRYNLRRDFKEYSQETKPVKKR